MPKVQSIKPSEWKELPLDAPEELICPSLNNEFFSHLQFELENSDLLFQKPRMWRTDYLSWKPGSIAKGFAGRNRFVNDHKYLWKDLNSLLYAIIDSVYFPCFSTDAYDKMQADLIKAKETLNKILTSRDVKATLLEMVEKNELNRSLLALQDENIANAQKGDQ
ncbi:hypothetical protein U1Q18_036667, partial [Sarracenia purpurea var. burkii]